MANSYCLFEFTLLNSSSEPAWAEACKLVLLVQPSSEAAERVFSILEHF